VLSLFFKPYSWCQPPRTGVEETRYAMDTQFWPGVVPGFQVRERNVDAGDCNTDELVQDSLISPSQKGIRKSGHSGGLCRPAVRKRRALGEREPAFSRRAPQASKFDLEVR
jgi:hypothetical protein